MWYLFDIFFVVILTFFMYHLLTWVNIFMIIMLKSWSGKLLISIPLWSVSGGLPHSFAWNISLDSSFFWNLCFINVTDKTATTSGLHKVVSGRRITLSISPTPSLGYLSIFCDFPSHLLFSYWLPVWRCANSFQYPKRKISVFTWMQGWLESQTFR